MNLIDLYRHDSRPDKVLSLSQLPDFVKDTPNWAELSILLYARKEELELSRIEEIAPKLGFGSVLLIEKFPEKLYETFAAKIARNDFVAWDKFGIEHGARAWVKSVYNGDTTGSHWVYLKRACLETEGPVLEMGTGAGSTVPLHLLCKEANRQLYSLDNDAKWIDRYIELEDATHRFICLPDPAQTGLLNGTINFGVVFVDHAPGESRKVAIARAREISQYIVVHDTEELGYDVESVLMSFKYRRDFKRSRPWTTVVSNSKEIWRD